MNKLFKVCFAAFVVLMIMKFPARAFFGLEPNQQVPSGLNFTTLTSSGTVFPRGGVMYAIFGSTGNGTTEYFQAFDTAAFVPAGGTAYTAFQTSTQTVCPATLFTSTVSLAGTLSLGYGSGSVNYMPYGATIVNGLYIWISAVGKQVTVLWSK